jgi:uncharacterized membrane-anchored protein YhcB (DUF1043 family)
MHPPLRTSMTVTPRRPRTIALAIAVGCCLGFAGAAIAQSSTKDAAKQTKELQKAVQKARESLEKTAKDLKKTLETYNGIMGGKEKKVSSAHKDLAKSVDGLIKDKDKNRGRTDAMQTQVEQFFKSWEADLAKMGNEDLKQASQKRLEETRTRYGELRTATDETRKEYDTLLASLSEQVKVLGRDMSSEAIAALQGEAKKVNEQSAALLKKVEEATAAMKQREQALGK